MSAELIDPRGPRFGAAITSALSLTAFGIAVSANDGFATAYPLIVLLAVLFSWSVFSPKTHPYGLIFKKLVRPRLSAPKELEDPRPPQFAQLIGLIVAGAGVVLYLVGLQGGLVYAAGAAFIAAFLNAAFAFCLGCQIYVGLQRIGLIKKF